MPLQLKPRAPLPPFTFAPSPPQPLASSSKSTMPSHPPADFFPERDMHTFGSHPLAGGRAERGRGLVSCGLCGRVTMESAWAEHQRVCKSILEGSPVGKTARVSGKSIKTSETKKRRASEESDEGPSRKKPPKQPTDRNVNLLPPKPSDDTGNKGVKLKKNEIKRLNKEKERLEKKEMKDKEKAEAAERKRLRVSGPPNLDKQCGVINDKGHPCARSLTCKTHTVGAKRAVPGRTRGYDELYLEWQRANNPKFKEPTKIMGKKIAPVAGKTPGTGGGGKDKAKGKMEEDDTLGGRLMGEAEVRELVQFTRMAGERCRLTISSIGGGGGVSAKSSRYSPSTASSKSASSRGSATARHRKRYPSSGYCGGYGEGAWGANMAFAGVGEALIQALAARPARIEPIRLIVPANPCPAPSAGDAGPSNNIIVSAPTPTLANSVQGQVAAQSKKQGRPTGLSMPPNQHQLQAQMQMQVLAQQAQAQAQLGQQGLGKGFIPPHIQQQMQGQAQQGQMTPQAMIAAAASAASAVNAGLAGLQGQGMGMQGMGGAAGGMSMLQQYQHGLMQQQQAGMMQAGQAQIGMYGQS